MNYFLHVAVGGLYVRHIKARDPSDTRAVVVHTEGVVVEADEDAQKRGCLPGTKASEAKVILREGGRLIELVPEDYLEARNEWLDKCLGVSFFLESHLPHSATVSLAGHPDQYQAATDLVQVLARETPYSLSVGLSNVPWVARRLCAPCDLYAARLGLTPFEVHTSQSETFRSMPTLWLDPVEPLVRERLCFLGYRRIGDVASAPQSVLVRQFGKQGIVAKQAALGLSVHTLRPNYPSLSVTGEVRFEACCQDMLAIDQALKQLATDVSRQLIQHGCTANAAMLVFQFEEASAVTVKKRHPKPVQRQETLFAFYSQAFTQLTKRPDLVSIVALASDLVAAPIVQTSLSFSKEKPRSSPDAALALVKSAFGTSSLMVANEIEVSRRKRLLQLWRNSTGWT